MTFRISFIILLLALSVPPCLAGTQTVERRVTVAVLDFGDSETGRRVADRVAAIFKEAGAAGPTKVALVDRDLSRAAALGAGYSGSLNLTLKEARDLGAAIGCDFYVIGDAQTVPRSSLAVPLYHEAYASIFIVSARTGRLVMWHRPFAEAATPEEAEAKLAPELNAHARLYRVAVLRAFEDEESARRRATTAGDAGDAGDGAEVIDLSSDEGAGVHVDVRDPAPYRRLRPAYPDTAERAGAEATVDAAVEIGADGEVARVEIVRWAGFGLDEAVTATVRQMHFRPATREGVPVLVRVLLRYNFRRPTKDKR